MREVPSIAVNDVEIRRRQSQLLVIRRRGSGRIRRSIGEGRPRRGDDLDWDSELGVVARARDAGFVRSVQVRELEPRVAYETCTATRKWRPRLGARKLDPTEWVCARRSAGSRGKREAEDRRVECYL